MICIATCNDKLDYGNAECKTSQVKWNPFPTVANNPIEQQVLIIWNIYINLLGRKVKKHRIDQLDYERTVFHWYI